jgi:hypothetical protein
MFVNDATGTYYATADNGAICFLVVLLSNDTSSAAVVFLVDDDLAILIDSHVFGRAPCLALRIITAHRRFSFLISNLSEYLHKIMIMSVG